MPSGTRPVTSAMNQLKIASSWLSCESRFERNSAGIARMPRKKTVHRFCRWGGSISRSIGYVPSLPVKGGYGSATSSVYARTWVV